MRYFPIFIDLEGRKVVVVGGSEEAVRKVRLLQKTSAHINVIAASLAPELQGAGVKWLATSYEASLLDGAALVYSAERELNAQVAADAQVRGIPFNAVDDAETSTFIVPSLVDRDPVVVAIGTEGTAPVLAQAIRAQVDQLLAPGTGALATAASAVRPRVPEHVPAGGQRRAFWHRFFFGEPRDALLSGDSVAFELAVGDALYQHSQKPTGRVSHIQLASDDVDDVTLKAHRLLREADVIALEGEVPRPVLELARRDALRIDSGDQARMQSALNDGQHVVHVTARSAKASGNIVPFPVREDLRDAILRAVS